MTRLSKVLVTGGAGFIGSHMVDALMTQRFHVKVVDNLSGGSLCNIESWVGNRRFEFVQGDLKDPSVALESVKDVELVLHLAANPDVRLGASDPSAHFDENLLATFNLLEAMRKSVKARRVVFASTSTVYGEADVLPTPEDYGPLLPISVYGAAKLGCEALIASYCHTFGLSAVLLRFANIVGSRAKHGVIVDFIKKLQQNPRELEILGDGRQKKSYLHVKDFMSALFTILDCSSESGRVDVFNVGSQDHVDVKCIAKIVSKEMGVKPRFKFNDSLSDGRGWKGDVRFMHLSTERLRGLDWKPTLTSEEAVRLSCREFLRSEN